MKPRKQPKQPKKPNEPEAVDWKLKCIICGMAPAYPTTRMCAPHTFGEADTGPWACDDDDPKKS